MCFNTCLFQPWGSIWGSLGFCNSKRKLIQMHSPSSHATQHFMHVCLHAQMLYMQHTYAPDEPQLFDYQKNPKIPNSMPGSNGAGSGISLVQKKKCISVVRAQELASSTFIHVQAFTSYHFYVYCQSYEVVYQCIPSFLIAANSS